MKKWFKYFFLGFFSHSTAKGGAKRGYANIILSLVLAMVFIWAGSLGGYMLPFGVHYNNSPDIMEAAHTVLANADINKRIDATKENGSLKLKKHNGEYTEELLVNTMESDTDKLTYSLNGFNIVVDSRPASTLAEIEAYCISNDGKNTIISYDEYLTLSDVARLNFDFKLKYTGKTLVLNDELVEKYKAYVDSVSNENKALTEKIASDLAKGAITITEYNRAIYELYFTNYYPEITKYESTSKVPLLRNYYYHQYISQGLKDYLFIFDDYMAGSFKTKSGNEISFYGFYNDFENGAIITEGASQKEANIAIDQFIKKSFKSNWILNAYTCLTNTITLVPFMALMIMVAALLTYSTMKLRGVESISSLGAMLKIVGSFVWFAALVASLLAMMLSFIVKHSLLNVLPQVLFFLALVVRAIIFAINENKLYLKQLEKAEQTEV